MTRTFVHVSAPLVLKYQPPFGVFRFEFYSILAGLLCYLGRLEIDLEFDFDFGSDFGFVKDWANAAYREKFLSTYRYKMVQCRAL